MKESAGATIKRAAAHWDSVRPSSNRTRWWQSPTIIRHINQRVCGERLEGMHAGFHHCLKNRGAPFKRGVSIGCGTGRKEMDLLESGIVDTFYVFEISRVRVEEGKKAAEARGLADRIHFSMDDPFRRHPIPSFELVYWNNALHHMADTKRALQWSYAILKRGGTFAMDDYIGPDRFQWPDQALQELVFFRKLLPLHLKMHPTIPNAVLTVGRPSLEDMIATDPSEAADSANIIPSLQEVFPDVEIIYTGGYIYHPGLKDILANFPEQSPELEFALKLDDKLSWNGMNQYAVAYALK